jgi:hypothetical protein
MESHIGRKLHSLLALREEVSLALRGDAVLLEAAVHIARVGAEVLTINVPLVCLGTPIQPKALLEQLLVSEAIPKDSVRVIWTSWLICLR